MTIPVYNGSARFHLWQGIFKLPIQHYVTTTDTTTTKKYPVYLKTNVYAVQAV